MLVLGSFARAGHVGPVQHATWRYRQVVPIVVVGSNQAKRGHGMNCLILHAYIA